MGIETVGTTLLEPLSGELSAYGAAELGAIGAACGAVGVWVLHFGRAFLAESFSHALLPGLVVAAALGASLVAGAIVGIVAAYALLLIVQRAPKTSDASATAIVVTALLAFGAYLASTGTGAISFENLLFGEPLATSRRQFLLSLVFAAAIASLLALLHDRFAAVAFDASAAAGLGINVGLVSAALVAVVVVAVAVAASVTGSLLALAFLTGPALGASALTTRLASSVLLSAAGGSLCGVAGIYVSFVLDWPVGASVALVASAMALAGVVAGRSSVFRPSGAAGPA